MAQDPSGADRYRQSGVDIDRASRFVEAIGGLARSTARPGAAAALGGFGGLFDLKATGFRDPLLVACADGVGTKVLLAAASGRHAAVGTDLVAMCVNDLVVQGAEPLFFLDYLATSQLEPRAAEAVLEGIAAGCREAGCALIGGETAEMPGLYRPGDYDLAGFAVGAVERERLLPRADIEAGDIILGLASSGAHANGFSLIRLVLREQGLGLDDPAPFEPGRTLADLLLEPTRIYVRSCLAALETGAVKALAHITGGGLVENVPRVLPDGLQARIDVRSWPLPALFAWLREAGRLDPRELARTFNAGIGMVLVVAAGRAETVAARLVEQGETVYAIGEIRPARDGRVLLEGLEAVWAGEPRF